MIKINHDPIILTQSLIQCASVTPEDNGVIECVKNHLESFGCKCEVLEFSSEDSYNVKNLFASIGENGKHFAFAGHTDVVPEGQESSWQHKPFSGDITYGKIPPYSVLVPGSLPDKKNPLAPSLNCAVIIKQVDEKTRSKTSINDLLRD